MANRSWPTGIRPSRSGKGIEIRIYKDGKSFYEKTFKGSPHNKRDIGSAVEFRDKLEARLALGLPLESGLKSEKLTFGRAVKIYLNSLDCKESSLGSITGIINSKWLPVFDYWPIDEITDLHIQDFLDDLNVSVKYKKNILSPLRGIFKRSRIVPNPVDGVLLSNRLQKRQKTKIERYSPAERDILLGALKGEHKVYFALLFGCGLRPSGEPLGLQWDDYDGTTIHIHQQIQHGKVRSYTKTDVERDVTVPFWVRTILNNHDTRFAKGYIFVNPESENSNKYHYDAKKFNKAWELAHKATRIKRRKPYTCRHSRAAELLSNGVNVAEAAQEFGHSVQMFLNTYSEYIAEFVDGHNKSVFEGDIKVIGEKAGKNPLES